MSNFMKVSSESAPRVELHEKLGLTGAEISINTIGAGKSVPFIHSCITIRTSYITSNYYIYIFYSIFNTLHFSLSLNLL